MIQESNINYLCAIDKEKEDSLEHRMKLLDEKVMYGTLHGTYKKALQKALQTKSKSLCLIEILEAFANENSESEPEDEESDEESGESDKENTNMFQLRNPRIRRGKGRPVGTKDLKHLMRRIKAKTQSKGVAKNVVDWVIIKKTVMFS